MIERVCQSFWTPFCGWLDSQRIGYGVLNGVYFGLLCLYLLGCAWANRALLSDGLNDVVILGTVLQFAVPLYAIVPILAKRDLTGAKQMVLYGIFIFVMVHIVKDAVGAVRPNGGENSFPSGHTAAAFCGVFFLWRRYGLKWTLYWALPAALFVGYSRIVGLYHWPRDVAGAIVLCALFVFVWVKRRPQGEVSA